MIENNPQMNQSASSQFLQESYSSNKGIQQFLKYAQFHQLYPTDIWKSSQALLTLNILEFAEMTQKNIGYKFSIKEINELHRIFLNNEINQEQFRIAFPSICKEQEQRQLGRYYSNVQINMTKNQFLKSKQSSSSKNYKNSHTNQSQESKENRKYFTDNFKNSGSKFSKSRVRSGSIKLTSNFFKNNFVQQSSEQQDTIYEEEQIQKKDKLEKLKQDMNINTLQKKWDFLVMTAEMNRWIQDLNSDKEIGNLLKYKIENAENEYLVVKVDKNDQEIIPENVFIKKYSALKKKWINKGANDLSNSKSINQELLKIFLPKSQTNNKIVNNREKQINDTLVEVQKMKAVFAQQCEMLSKIGINS